MEEKITRKRKKRTLIQERSGFRSGSNERKTKATPKSNWDRSSLGESKE